MKIGDIFKEDSYTQYAEFANENDLIIEEFGLDEETNEKTYILKEFAEPKELVLYKELNDIEQWFNFYDMQVIQYQRCLRLNIKYDKDIALLDKEAQEKAKRIKELREELNNVIQ